MFNINIIKIFNFFHTLIEKNNIYFINLKMKHVCFITYSYNLIITKIITIYITIAYNISIEDENCVRLFV
jgi:hypothetical protein